MIKYYDFEVNKCNNRVELRADYFYAPDTSQEESFIIGTPKCWNDTFFDRFDSDGYEILNVYIHAISLNNTSRVTDYKGVWGLKNIPKGIYSNYYDISGKRIYFGINKSNDVVDSFSQMSPIVIFIPISLRLKYDALFSCFCNSCANHLKNVTLLYLEELHALFPNIIALHYSVYGPLRLTIIGNNVDTLFSEEDCIDWQRETTIPLFHYNTGDGNVG